MPDSRPEGHPPFDALSRERVWALIAAHDEEATVGDVVARARPHVGAVWVVADGCRDGTVREAERAGARVLELGERRGKANALRHGWDVLAAEPGWTHLVLLDADGQHEPAAIPDFLAAAGDGSPDLVLGRRDLRDPAMPRLRRWTNRAMSFLLSRRLGRPVADSQCGFRLASRPFLASRAWRSGHFEIESEMVVHAAARGWRAAEVPVAVRYGAERSKIAPWRDGWRWCRFFASRMAPRRLTR